MSTTTIAAKTRMGGATPDHYSQIYTIKQAMKTVVANGVVAGKPTTPEVYSG